MIESNRREIERVHGFLENRGASEVGTYARVDEVNELRARLEQVTRERADFNRRDELGRTPSLLYVEQDRYPIPVYSSNHKTLPKFLTLFCFWSYSHQCKDAKKEFRIVKYDGSRPGQCSKAS